MTQGTFGEVKAFSHFTGAHAAIVPAATGEHIDGGWAIVGVNEGTYGYTVDEPGGILDITTDTADNDNHALVAGVFRPADGGMQMEARFKIPDSVATTRAAVFVGFSETLALDTPVMPAERATATTTYNGTGGMLGVLFDSDSTLLEWFAVAGDGGAAVATKDKNGVVGNANGIQLTGSAGLLHGSSATADRWYLVRVEVGTDGIGRVYFGDIDGNSKMQLVAENTTPLGTSDNFHAVLMVENRSGANERLEVDYAYARGWVDWATD